MSDVKEQLEKAEISISSRNMKILKRFIPPFLMK